MDKTWLQIRLYLQDSQIGFKKFYILENIIKPLIKLLIKIKYANNWHFLGVYRPKNKMPYIDLRFRINKKNISDCKKTIKELIKKYDDEKTITRIYFNETFYKKYLTRFKADEIEIILNTLQIYCEESLEENRTFKLLEEVDHLILFQADIDDVLYHLSQAKRWSKGFLRKILDLIIYIRRR